METFGKIISALLAVVVLIIAPLQYYSQKADVVTQSYVTAKTAQFVDTVRQQGKITQEVYKQFMDELDNTNELFKVEIEHSHTAVVPGTEVGEQYTANQIEEKHYEEEILYDLFERIPTQEEKLAGIQEGEYRMAKGDYITVTVSNREKGFTAKIQEAIYQTLMPSLSILTVYGGEVRDENY